MSMLRALPRASAWNSSEYICLCCRQRLLAQQQQQRGYSSNATSPESVDDWAESFNNLGADEEAKAKFEPFQVRNHAASVPLEGVIRKQDPMSPEAEDLRLKGLAGKPIIPSAKDDVFRKHDTHPLKEQHETKRQRMARMARTPPTMNFDSLKTRLENQLGGNKSAISQQQDGLSAAYQPFASMTDSAINKAVADAPVVVSRKSRPKKAEPRRQETVEEYKPSPVSGSASGGRMRVPKWEAILQEIKAEFTTVILPRLLADAAKKRLEDKKLGLPSNTTADQPTQSNNEPADQEHGTAGASTATRVGCQLPRHAAANNVDSEPTKFQRMYDESMKLNYQDQPKTTELQPIQEVQYSSIHRPLRHLTKPATTSGMRSPISNPVTELMQPSSLNTSHSTEDAAQAFLERLPKSRPSFSMEALMADLDKTVEGSDEMSSERKDDVESAGSEPNLLSDSMERDNNNLKGSLYIRKLRSTDPRPLSVMRGEMRREHAQEVHSIASKRSFSSLARHSAPATNNLDNEASLQSSTGPIPPWGMAGSQDNASTIVDTNQSTSDGSQVPSADQEFLSLLPNIKRTKAARARAPKSPTKTRAERRAEKRNVELADKVKSAEKATSAKKAKNDEKAQVSPEDVHAMLKNLLSKGIEKQSSPASKKRSKGSRIPRALSQDIERLLDSNTRDSEGREAEEASRVSSGTLVELIGKLSQDQAQDSSSGRRSHRSRTPTIRKLAPNVDTSLSFRKFSKFDSTSKLQRESPSNETAFKRRGVRLLRAPHLNGLGLSMRRRRPLRARITKHAAASKVFKAGKRASPEWQHRRALVNGATGSRSNAKFAKVASETGDPALSIEARIIKSEDAPNATHTESPNPKTLDDVQHELSQGLSAQNLSAIVSVDAANLEITPLDLAQPAVPTLQYGLDRALFNPGVFQLQDPHSRVYNFDPYLQKIMPVMEFDYNALKQYKTSSQDTALSDLAKEHDKRYIGSTSSMTGTLGHFHYLISAFRSLNLKMLSRSFPDSLESFTQINRAPNAIFLRKKGDGIYAIDADKEFDGPNVLMMLGKSMEKLLTLPKAEYERYRKENSHEVTEEERTAPEAYEYTTMGSFLMRSQLDAYDPRLPGTGMFDLKTRAVVSVRMNTTDYEPMTGYEIQTLQGRFQSYEREYYDMMRSTMLKYMLQARMGRMDGIFLAYHNVERIFGFQYVPIQEMDRAIHSQTDRVLGDQEFKLSLDLLNKTLDRATAKFPDSSLRLHFETTEEQIGAGKPTVMMWIFAEPISEQEIEDIQAGSRERMEEFERTMMGIERAQPDDEVQTEAVAHAIEGVNDSSNPESTAENDSEATASAREEDCYATTTSDAAPTFAPQLTKPRELKPLFSASIVCKSRVNDSVVDRPKFLKPDDKWELDYSLQEWEMSESTWARYEDMKTRRKAILEKNLRRKEKGEVDEDGEGEAEDGKKKDGYVDFLKSMSQVGRSYRERMDAIDAGREVVVVGQPVYAAEDVGAREEKIEGLEDYMGWLYRPTA